MAATLSYTDLITLAKTAEINNAPAQAIKNYNLALRLMPLNPYAYHRLMILHRRSRNYTKELAVINKAITRFGKAFHTGSSNKKIPDRSLRISRSLAKMLGLLDKKGNTIFLPEPLATWHRRKTIVQKKLPV